MKIVTLRGRQELEPYEFIGLGAMDVTKPYEIIGFGAMYVTKPYEFTWFGTHKDALGTSITSRRFGGRRPPHGWCDVWGVEAVLTGL